MDEKLITLAEKSMKGDMGAFEELIAAKQREILYITSRFCTPQDLEDCTQEALLLMYKNLNQLRDPSCFNDWMYSIIRNTCFAWNRKKNRRNNIAVMTPFDPSSEGLINTLEEEREEFMPVEYLESKEKKAEVLDAINTLPETYRECLLLFFYEEMSYKEIARAMQLNVKSVSNYLFRAKQELKKQLNLAISKNEIFSISAASAIPVLTQIFREDAKAKIPQELCDKMVKQSVSQWMAAGSASGVGAAKSAGAAKGAGVAKSAGATGTAAISKTAVSIISALVITGLAAGTIYTVNQNTPAASTVTSGEQTAAQILAEADAQAALIKPIDNPADMIGEDYLKKLISYEKNGVSKKEWLQFIKDIKAAEGIKAQTTKSNSYTMYTLEKQDKQLLMVTWERSGQELLQVKYQFGTIQKEPDIMDFIMMFSTN